MDKGFFDQCRQGFTEKLLEIWRNAAHSDSLLSRISTVALDHGMTTTVVDFEGVEASSKYEGMMATFELPHEVLESGDADAFRRVITNGVEQLRKQIHDQLFRRLKEVTERVGNAIDMRGKPLTGRALCDVFEKIHIEFDEHGHAKMPTMVVPPELYDHVRELFERPEVQLRLDVILREKWLAKYTLKVR